MKKKVKEASLVLEVSRLRNREIALLTSLNAEIERRRAAERLVEMHRNVRQIPKSELIKRAVGSARDRNKRGKHPRWVGVMWCFGLGSTFANQLCELYGFDPDEEVR